MINPLLIYSLYAIATFILAYRLIKLTKLRELALFSAILVLSIILFQYEGADTALLLSGVVIFSAIISSYGSRKCYLFILIGIVYAGIAYTAGAALMLQSLFLGMLAGSRLAIEKKKKTQGRSEIPRNSVQLLAGVLFIAAFYFLSTPRADALLFWFVIIGSILGNYALSRKEGALARFLHGLERSDAFLGSGARWLAIGALVAASFLTRDAVIAVFSAIFLADSFSTLVGVNFNTPKLPYNKNKSIGGTTAYFVTVLCVSYFFIGPIALPLAALAALFESQPFHIDDNFDVSLVMVAVFLVAAYLWAL